MPILSYWLVASFYDMLDVLDVPMLRRFRITRKQAGPANLITKLQVVQRVLLQVGGAQGGCRLALAASGAAGTPAVGLGSGEVQVDGTQGSAGGPQGGMQVSGTQPHRGSAGGRHCARGGTAEPAGLEVLHAAVCHGGGQQVDVSIMQCAREEAREEASRGVKGHGGRVCMILCVRWTPAPLTRSCLPDFSTATLSRSRLPPLLLLSD